LLPGSTLKKPDFFHRLISVAARIAAESDRWQPKSGNNDVHPHTFQKFKYWAGADLAGLFHERRRSWQGRYPMTWRHITDACRAACEQTGIAPAPTAAKQPPYARRIDTARSGGMVVVCTGSEAWRRAQSPTWFAGYKLVLPPGEDPTAYDWRIVADQDIIIGGFGNLEPIGTIAKLAGLLLAAGARLVLYAPERGPITRIEARRAA
jgi:hypothetical protein